MSHKCILPYCKDCYKIYHIGVFVIVLIILYFAFLTSFIDNNKPTVSKDVFNKKVINIPFLNNCCSWWPISHFILFFCLGTLFPDCGVLLMTGGLAWEGFEVCMDKIHERRTFTKTPDGENLQYTDGWWKGSSTDVFMNFAGFACGWFVAKKLGGKFCIKHINAKTSWCKKK